MYKLFWMNVVFRIFGTRKFSCEIWLKFNIKVRLHDQFQQTWREKIQNVSKTLSYRVFKEMFIFKQYIDILGEKDFLALCRKSLKIPKV